MAIQKIYQKVTVSANPSYGTAQGSYGVVHKIVVVPASLTGASLVLQQEVEDELANGTWLDVWTSPTVSGNAEYYPSVLTSRGGGSGSAEVQIMLLRGEKWRFKVTGATSGTLDIWLGLL